MSTTRTHAPQSPAREIVLRNVTGERWVQKDLRGGPYCLVVDGKKLWLQPQDLSRVALVCQLLAAEWAKEQADAMEAAVKAKQAAEVAEIEVHDFTAKVPA